MVRDQGTGYTIASAETTGAVVRGTEGEWYGTCESLDDGSVDG